MRIAGAASVVVATAVIACSVGAAAARQEAPAASEPRVSVQGPAPAPPLAAAEPVPVAVLPLGLTEATSRRYPQLAERNVGLGVHNMLVDHLYDTGLFRFVEEKPEVVADLVDRQWVASTGAVASETAVRHGRLLGARYVLYGEIYDFALRELGSAAAETRVAVQVRLVDVETSEYIPASGTAELLREGTVLGSESEIAFARSTVGRATDQALADAVETLMERFEPARAGDRGEG